MTDEYVIRVVELGSPVPDGYLQDYDPDAFDGLGDAHFTRDPDQAMKFVSPAAAMDCWRLQSTVRPEREDGKPNRPLSALTVEIAKL